MIDEKKLIDDILNNDGIEFSMEFDTRSDETILKSLNEFIKAWKKGIVELVQNQPKVGQWIPCSKRLPKEDGNYLISGVWGSGKEAVGDCDFSVNDGYFRTAWNFDVLAWMPLPKPYKESED